VVSAKDSARLHAAGGVNARVNIYIYIYIVLVLFFITYHFIANYLY